jgi:hypothetical protein
LGTLHTDLTKGSHATSRGEGTEQPPPEGLQGIFYRMPPEKQGHAILLLLQQLVILTRGLPQSHSRPAQSEDNSQ